MRILLFSYYFPPQGGAGSIRWSHLIRELGQEHRINVVCPELEPGTIEDPGLLEMVSNNCTVHRTPLPKWWRHLKRRSKGLSAPSGRFIFMPDSRSWWIGKAYALSKRIGNKPDVVIATSPPFSAAMAGMKAARHFGVPFVLDMRDSFLNDPNTGYLPEPNRLRREHLFFKVLHQTSAIVTVNPIVQREMDIQARYGIPTSTIPNGYDRIDVRPTNSDKIHITLTGRFFRTLNDPSPLLDAMTMDKKITATFIGPSEGLIEEKANELGISERVTVTGSKTYSQVRKILAASDMHFFFMDPRPGNINKIPSKLWDFLSTGQPVVACASPLSTIFQVSPARVVQSGRSPEAILDAIHSAVKVEMSEPENIHTWQCRADQYINFLTRLIRK